MTTLLDAGLLQNFSFIFPFIFVWALIFAILQKTKITNGSTGIDATIAVVIAFMSILSDAVTQMINFMIPWFTVAIIFFVLLLLIFQLFGAKESDILAALKTPDNSVIWVILGIGLIIAFAALGNVLGQGFTEAAFDGQQGTALNATGGTATLSFQANIRGIISHPKVLGLIILFAIAVFAIALLSGSSAK